jgi:hypothetical protein
MKYLKSRLAYTIELIKALGEAFKGKKTFIVGLIMIAIGLKQKDQNLVFGGLIAMTGRDALNQVINKLK